VLGVNVARYKLIAFVLSARMRRWPAVTSCCSTVLLYPGNIRLPALDRDSSSWPSWAGSSSIFGSIVGAAIPVLLPQFLTVFHDYEHIVLGAIIIVFLIFLPAGIVPAASSFLRRRPA
jgi:branched-chain amino acid transport system permease protein